MSATDIMRLKQDHPIAEVVARYGIELRPSGRTLVARCPFHADGGRPNFHVYPSTASWFCYRCGVGGDVIGFVRRMEQCGFHQAVERIESTTAAPISRRPPFRPPSPPPRVWRPVERACLAAAVAFYHHRLLETPAAPAYWESRGLDRRLLSECRVGYATGRGLVDDLRQRRLPIQAAIRVGVLRPNGREFFAGRLVIPEMRHGQPTWLIGRAISSNDNRPKYLSLPGPKPLFGWEAAARQHHIVLTEGVFDVLTLCQWGVPALALLGTHAPSDAVRALLRFRRIYLALDNDEAGRAATADLRSLLGSRAVPVLLPGGVKDVADLALLSDGKHVFFEALQCAGYEIEQEGE